MLIIQDTFVVRGRDELPFQDGYHDAFATALAASDADAELAFFGWAPHGGGEGYEGVALTLVPDVEALARHHERLAVGDLASLHHAAEGQLHSLSSTAHVLADWSPLADRTLESPSLADHQPTLFVLHTFTLDGSIPAAVAALDDQHRTASADDLLGTEACFTPLLGDLATPQINVLSRVSTTEGLKAALANPDPAVGWTGTPRAPGVSHRQTRLLRTVTWSPIR